MIDTKKKAPFYKPPFYKPWMSKVLILAGLYNLVWGSITVIFPNLFFDLLSIARPNYPELWQCIGMIIAVFGFGYIIAATNPLRHWPIVFVGLSGKIFGPIGFIYGVLFGNLPASFGYTILTNDLIWWIPFYFIIYNSYLNYSYENSLIENSDQNAIDVLQQYEDGLNVLKISESKPILLVFLRHFGCVFCKEVLVNLKNSSAANKYQLVFVHMVDNDVARNYLSDFKDAILISDPNFNLYRAFNLKKGTLLQLFNMKSIIKAIKLFFKGITVGPLLGNGFQMPGTFVIYNKSIIYSYRPENVAEEANLEPALTCSIN
jgi:hypothetical protein